jgi:hypothetical protein
MESPVRGNISDKEPSINVLKEFIHAGTYEVDSATVKVEGEQQKHTLTITKISDTEMVAEHGGSATIEFKKEK